MEVLWVFLIIKWTIFTVPGWLLWHQASSSLLDGALLWLWRPWTTGLCHTDGKGFFLSVFASHFCCQSGAQTQKVIRFAELSTHIVRYSTAVSIAPSLLLLPCHSLHLFTIFRWVVFISWNISWITFLNWKMAEKQSKRGKWVVWVWDWKRQGRMESNKRVSH